MKKLYRSEDNRIWKGILGGIGEYFQVDPVIIRLIFVILFIVTMGVPMIIFYVLAIFIVPNRPSTEPREAEVIHESN